MPKLPEIDDTPCPSRPRRTRHRQRGLDPRIALTLLLCLEACGAIRADSLRPDHLPPGHAALFGRIQVLASGKDVTGACSVHMTHGSRETVQPIGLRPGGWVFVSALQGKAKFGRLVCVVSWQDGLVSAVPGLEFVVSEPGTATYFGDIVYTTREVSPWERAGLNAAGLAVRRAINASAVDLHADAYEEFVRRYGQRGQALQISTSIAGAPPDWRQSVKKKGELVVSEIPLANGSVLWLGRATVDKQDVAIRLRRTTNASMPPDCDTAHVSADGQETTHAAEYRVRYTASGKSHIHQISLPIQTVESAASGTPFELDLCGWKHPWNEDVQRRLTEFLAEYRISIAVATKKRRAIETQRQRSARFGGALP